MKHLDMLAMLCVASITIVSVRADAPKSDKELFQGAWVLQRGETDGIPLVEVLDTKGIGNLQIDFSGDTMKMSGFGTQNHKYRFTLKPDEKPKAIDSMAEETQGKAIKGTLVPGIYKIDGDTLTLCLANNPAAERPKEFKAPKGSRLSLLVLTRTKP
jgi:uncharacterized protein (TIGR03067 family)